MKTENRRVVSEVPRDAISLAQVAAFATKRKIADVLITMNLRS